MITVGKDSYRPWDKYPREGLEYSARELGFAQTFIDELSDKELFDIIIKEGCRASATEEGSL